MSHPNTEPTQERVILERLMSTPGVPVPMPELATLSGSMNVHSRIHALNLRLGWPIRNTKKRKGRRWLSSYTYVAKHQPQS